MQISAPSPSQSPATSAATAPAWSEKFVGRTLAYYHDFFPNWEGIWAKATSVIGDPQGYASLADARAAVATLKPKQPIEDPKNWRSYPNAVAYLKNDVGSVAAFELDQKLLEYKGFFKQKLVTARDYLGRDERVIAIDNFQGEVPCRGIAEGVIVV